MYECIDNFGKVILVLISGNTENIGVIMAACFDTLVWVVADGGADAFEAVSLHRYALGGIANQNTKSVGFVIIKNSMSNGFGAVVIVVLGVVGGSAKIREGNMLILKPLCDAVF